jgi:rubrerythrin
MENWKEHLAEHLKEELSDSVTYAEMARHADGCYRQMLHDMAQEEWEHAHAVWHMMEHSGMTAGMDKRALFHDAMAALYK